MTEAKKKIVYLVEDDEFLGSVLSDHLIKSGFDATLITSGDKALETIKGNVPDILLLDIFLPGLNGLELLEELRKDESTKNLKVFVVSNTDQSDSRNKAKELGADFIIKAATTPGEIIDLVKKALGL